MTLTATLWIACGGPMVDEVDHASQGLTGSYDICNTQDRYAMLAATTGVSITAAGTNKTMAAGTTIRITGSRFYALPPEPALANYRNVLRFRTFSPNGGNPTDVVTTSFARLSSTEIAADVPRAVVPGQGMIILEAQSTGLCTKLVGGRFVQVRESVTYATLKPVTYLAASGKGTGSGSGNNEQPPPPPSDPTGPNTQGGANKPGPGTNPNGGSGWLRFLNNTPFAAISVQINGVEQITTPGYGILAGTSGDSGALPTGSVSYSVVLGEWNGNVRDVYYTLSGTDTIRASQASVIDLQLTLCNVLTNGAAQATFSGDYWVGAQPNYASFRFTDNRAAGRCELTLYNNGSFQAQGSARLVSWGSGGTTVTMQLCASGNCYTTSMAFPYSSFFLQNGPPGWPNIQYVRQ
jgi:hypothetical protein